MENLLSLLIENLLLMVAGFVAGIINTVAGSGSVLTLSALSFQSMPTGLANGTNRVGVLLQTLAGYRSLRSSSIGVRALWWLILPTILGAILGAEFAIYLGKVNELWLNRSIGLTMLLMLFLVLRNPQRWLKEGDKSLEIRGLKKMTLVLLFVLVGAYGGFVQAGVGVIMLVLLVAFGGYDMKTANAIKLLLTFILNIPAFILFFYENQIVWQAAFVLAISQVIGTWAAVRFVTTHPKANYWVRQLLILVLLVAIVHFLGIGT